MKVKKTVAINAHEVIARCIEVGITRGLNRAHKHSDEPSRDCISENIYRATMEELSDVLQFEP